MSFLSEKTTKSSHLNAEPETGQSGAAELSAQGSTNISPHLEDILGRINSIMSDASGGMKNSNHCDTFSSADRGRDRVAFDADHSVFQGEQRNDNPRGREQGFVASEPSDLLKPYSEVLGEVRDYFNDRHSLDANDSLMHSQPRSSLTDDIRRVVADPDGNAFTAPPSSVHEWGEEVELKFQEAVALEGEAPALAERSRDVFSPIKFANPFDRQSERARASMEVLAPEAEGFQRLRNDLVDRIAQLEQVIGHHFGDQKQVATEAAQAAIRMTLQNLDDTTLGRRLSDIETAFMLFQKNQDQKNLETKQSIMKMGAELRKVTHGAEGGAGRSSLGVEDSEGERGIKRVVDAGQVDAPVSSRVEAATPNLILTPVLSAGAVQAGDVQASAGGEVRSQDMSGVKGGAKSVAGAVDQSSDPSVTKQGVLGGPVSQAGALSQGIGTPPKVPQTPHVPEVGQISPAALADPVVQEAKVSQGVSDVKPESAAVPVVGEQKSGKSDAEASKSEQPVGLNEFSQPLDYIIGDIQVPGGAVGGGGQLVFEPGLPPKLPTDDDGFPQVISGMVELPVDGAVEQKKVIKSDGLNDDALASSEGAAELISDGMNSIEQMRELLKGSGEPRQFGKNDKSRDAMGNLVTAAEGAHSKGDAELDDYLQKSAALRAQFKQAKIVSNDDDLHSMDRKGGRIAIGVIVFTLLLAAVGVAMQNDTKSLQNLINTIVTKVKDFPGGLKTPERLGQQSSVGGVVSDGKGIKKSSDINNVSGEADMTVTGNINGAEQRKPALKGAAEKADGVTETALGSVVLPAVEGSDPGLPPALIGPYSLRYAASKGDVAAQYEVARRFGLGQGIPRDHEQAVKWYMLAAAQGFAPAQYRLATYYERGRGVKKNLERAKVWYQRAAELGNVKAMHNLAVVSTAFTQGDADYKKAIHWFKEAGNRNLADSQFNLAILYQNGVGLKKDLVQAYKWFSLAARQGDQDASSRRDGLEKLLTKKQIFEASKILQNWKSLDVIQSANKVGGISTHMTSTMSHADETITRSRVLTAQILLRKLGYGLDEADGALNDQTIMAIKKFEKDKGLPITGKVSGDLLKYLNKASL